MEICRLEHIRKDYLMGETVTPLKDINLDVSSGDFIAIEGPSGVGKSTLLYVMGTLLQSDGGRYVFLDQDLSKLDDGKCSQIRAKKIGFLFQDPTMIQALTLRENLAFVQEVGARPWRWWAAASTSIPARKPREPRIQPMRAVRTRWR